MSLDLLQILYAVFLPTALGTGIIKILCRGLGLSRLFLWTAGFGMGCGILGQWMLLLGIAGLPLNRATIEGPLWAAVLLVWFLLRRYPRPPQTPTPQSFSDKWSTLEILFAAFIAAHVCWSFWYALNTPVRNWDGVSFIAFPAKIFFYEHCLYQPQNLPHPDYPLQVPFLMTWTALTLGRWDEMLIKVFSPSCFLACLGTYYHFLRSYTDRRWALGGTVVLLSSAFFTYHAGLEYRDIFMLYFNCSTIFTLLLWRKFRHGGLLVMAGLFSGFTTFTKLEGTSYLAIHTIMAGIILLENRGALLRDVRRRFLLFIIPASGIWLVYILHKIALQIPLSEETTLDFNVASIQRLLAILQRFNYEMFFSGNWNLVWFFWTMSLLKIPTIWRKKDVLLLIASTMLYLGFYLLLALLTTKFTAMGDPRSRVFLHFFPLAAAALVLIHAPRADDAPTVPRTSS